MLCSIVTLNAKVVVEGVLVGEVVLVEVVAVEAQKAVQVVGSHRLSLVAIADPQLTVNFHFILFQS